MELGELFVELKEYRIVQMPNGEGLLFLYHTARLSSISMKEILSVQATCLQISRKESGSRLLSCFLDSTADQGIPRPISRLSYCSN